MLNNEINITNCIVNQIYILRFVDRNKQTKTQKMKKTITLKEFDKLVKDYSKPAIDACRQNGIKISQKDIKENTANELLEEYTIEG